MTAPLSGHLVTSPRTLEEALAFLAAHAGEGWRPVAGGTDVMVEMDHGRATATRWLSLHRIRRELAGVTRAPDGRVRIGGGATMTELRRSPLLRAACPLIGEAAATVGAVQIQNRATVAGNVANASPAGDTLPVWLALEAHVELGSASGTRLVAYRDFTPSYRTTVARPDEIITAILFTPPEPGTRILFRKVGTRAAQAISKVVLAALARTGPDGRYSDVRLAFGSMAPVPVRARRAEEAALGQPPGRETGLRAAAELARDLTPIDDLRSTAAYRMGVARNLVRELLAGGLGVLHAGGPEKRKGAA
jgi:CO/xanthine dehydrogenase FAD-binding subunit